MSMPAAEQHHRWNVSAEAHGSVVIIQTGTAEPVALSPRDAQAFAFQLAGAYLTAGHGSKPLGNWRITPPPAAELEPEPSYAIDGESGTPFDQATRAA